MSRAAPAVLTTALLAAALSGCMTQRITPTPSAAILQSRAQARATPSAEQACATLGAVLPAPVFASFAFDDGAMTDAGRLAIDGAVPWLTCNPGVKVVILAEADHHHSLAEQQALADQRAAGVAAYFAEKGVGADRVVSKTFLGAQAPATPPGALVVNARGRGW